MDEKPVSDEDVRKWRELVDPPAITLTLPSECARNLLDEVAARRRAAPALDAAVAVAEAAWKWAETVCAHHERLWQRTAPCDGCDRIEAAEEGVFEAIRVYAAAKAAAGQTKDEAGAETRTSLGAQGSDEGRAGGSLPAPQAADVGPAGRAQPPVDSVKERSAPALSTAAPAAGQQGGEGGTPEERALRLVPPGSDVSRTLLAAMADSGAWSRFRAQIADEIRAAVAAEKARGEAVSFSLHDGWQTAEAECARLRAEVERLKGEKNALERERGEMNEALRAELAEAKQRTVERDVALARLASERVGATPAAPAQRADAGEGEAESNTQAGSDGGDREVPQHADGASGLTAAARTSEPATSHPAVEADDSMVALRNEVRTSMNWWLEVTKASRGPASAFAAGRYEGARATLSHIDDLAARSAGRAGRAGW